MNLYDRICLHIAFGPYGGAAKLIKDFQEIEAAAARAADDLRTDPPKAEDVAAWLDEISAWLKRGIRILEGKES